MGLVDGVVFVVVGVVLVNVGWAIWTNFRGAHDWLFEAQQRAWRVLPTGFAPTRARSKAFGGVAFLLGCGFLIGGVSLL